MQHQRRAKFEQNISTLFHKFILRLNRNQKKCETQILFFQNADTKCKILSLTKFKTETEISKFKFIKIAFTKFI